ncbi:MAG TPA: hypothetical protein VLH84_01245 [Patescibacteria group bacterium]|nr:hypothetical protein [Patescibacteria group bacterium]
MSDVRGETSPTIIDADTLTTPVVPDAIAPTASEVPADAIDDAAVVVLPEALVEPAQPTEQVQPTRWERIKAAAINIAVVTNPSTIIYNLAANKNHERRRAAFGLGAVAVAAGTLLLARHGHSAPTPTMNDTAFGMPYEPPMPKGSTAGLGQVMHDNMAQTAPVDELLRTAHSGDNVSNWSVGYLYQAGLKDGMTKAQAFAFAHDPTNVASDNQAFLATHYVGNHQVATDAHHWMNNHSVYDATGQQAAADHLADKATGHTGGGVAPHITHPGPTHGTPGSDPNIDPSQGGPLGIPQGANNGSPLPGPLPHYGGNHEVSPTLEGAAIITTLVVGALGTVAGINALAKKRDARAARNTTRRKKNIQSHHPNGHYKRPNFSAPTGRPVVRHRGRSRTAQPPGASKTS